MTQEIEEVINRVMFKSFEDAETMPAFVLMHPANKQRLSAYLLKDISTAICSVDTYVTDYGVIELRKIQSCSEDQLKFISSSGNLLHTVYLMSSFPRAIK